eukprot:289725_1
MKHTIITSDYKIIEKTVIHRIISKHPQVRNIPRIFIFDSCSGVSQREIISQTTTSMDENDESDDIIESNGVTLELTCLNDIKPCDKGPIKTEETNLSKMVSLTEISNGNEWTSDTKNPDYKLVIINAANIGFKAGCNTEFGSHLIYEFTLKIKRNILYNEKKSLATILDEIQNKLHDSGQQITKTFNNNTRHLKLIVNKKL